ncbi:MAG: class I SAM-dependent methyltransferase, partial [Chloroflexota bacterium]
ADRRALWQRRFDRVLADRTPGRLLDVGAGIGTFLAIARDSGWTVEGTEVSTTAVAYARDLHDVALRLGTLEEAGPDGPFDAITLWHVIEHVPDPVATLRACHDRLAGDGTLILAMPNDDDAAWAATSAGNATKRLLGRATARRYETLRPGVESHIQHFRPETIRAALADAGFGVRATGVDDAAPQRSAAGRAVFGARRLATALTPWNLGREMLVIAVTTSSPGR